MSDFVVVKVEEVWRCVVGLEDREVLSAEVRIRLLSGQNRKEKAEICVV